MTTRPGSQSDLLAIIQELESGNPQEAIKELKQIARDKCGAAALLAKMFVDAGDSISMFLVPLKKLGVDNDRVVRINISYAKNLEKRATDCPD